MTEPGSTNDEMPEEVAILADWARGSKNDLVARTKADENDDLRPMIELRRDGEVVGMVVCPDVDRDQALQAIHIAVPGWGADYMVMLLDAHMADQKFIETYGRMPDPGELQRLCDVEGACDLGLTTDCIIMVEGWRSGRQRMTQLPYHVHKTARTVHWIEDERMHTMDTDTLKPGSTFAGRITDAITAVFQIPRAQDKMKEEFDPAEFGLDPDGLEAQIHMDLAVMRILGLAGFATAFNARTDLHQQLLERFLESTANFSVVDPDGSVRQSTGEPGLLDVIGLALQNKLKEERQMSRAGDLAAAEMLRAERELAKKG